MGEFTGDKNVVTNNIAMGNADAAAAGVEQKVYNTDVDGITADDVVKQGKDEFPCFDVSKEEFYQNMQDGRKRIRFKTEKAAKYMQGTKYNRPFFVRHTDEAGKKYVRKIK